MKNQRKIGLAYGLVLFIVISSCQEDNHQLVSDKDLGNPSIELRTAPCVPSYNTLDELNTNMDWLAISLVKFGQDSRSTVKPLQFRREVESELNEDNEVYISTLMTKISGSHFKIPKGGPMDIAMFNVMYDYNRNSPPTKLPAWDRCLYEIFEWGTSREIMAVFVDVLDFDILSDEDKNKPLMVIAAHEGRVIDDNNPVFGYYYDEVLDTIQEKKLISDDELSEFIAKRKFYFWLLDVEGFEPNTHKWWSCETGVVCGDGVCDIICGEDTMNCAADCNLEFNRTVRLESMMIRRDYRTLSSYLGPRYDEKRSKYEVAYSASIIHGAGNTSKLETNAFCNVRPKVKRRDIRRMKFTTAGFLAKDKGEDRIQNNLHLRGVPGELPLISENFNPAKDRIYLFFYEHDWIAKKRKVDIWAFPDTINQTNAFRVSNELFCRSSDEVFGLIHPNGQPHYLYNKEGPDYPKNYSTFVVEIQPGDWTFNSFEGPSGTGRYTFEGNVWDVAKGTGGLRGNTFQFTLIYE